MCVSNSQVLYSDNSFTNFTQPPASFWCRQHLIMIVFLRYEKYFWVVCYERRKSGAFFLMRTWKKRSDVKLSVIARIFGDYCDDSFRKCLVFEKCIERNVGLICYARLWVPRVHLCNMAFICGIFRVKIQKWKYRERNLLFFAQQLINMNFWTLVDLMHPDHPFETWT